MFTLFITSLLVLAYVLIGYPLLLRLIVAVRGPRMIRRADITPKLSFIVSAYNEAEVIREKIENALSLDYPAESRQIVVISDCSSDGTDAIVQEFASRGVMLARMAERRGKTAGLNTVVPTLTGEVLVFSDANAIYEHDALRKLVRNFADESVGFVTGEARYVKTGQAAADVGERAYWNYEIQMKRLETQLGSMVGGDGAIYAIRKKLWQRLPDDAINDFLNPLQIIAAGWRGVYEPDAVCWEETGGSTKSEYKRRVRIVSRSWRAVFQAPGVLNPFKVGLFAWSLWSHKVLRWTIGLAVIGFGVGFVGAYGRWWLERPLLAAGCVGGLVLAAATSAGGRRLSNLLAYFMAINTASMVGIYRGTMGHVSGVWSTPREAGPAAAGGWLIPVGPLFLYTAAASVVALTLAAAQGIGVASFIYLGLATALLYVYVFYPLLLSVFRTAPSRQAAEGTPEPSVVLLIAANDEEAVIDMKLRNSLDLDYPSDKLRVVVASDGSVDRTNSIVGGFSGRVTLLSFSPRRGKIAAINSSMASLDSEIVVFSDANTFLETGAIRNLVRRFADPNVGAVSGDVVLVGDRAAFARSEDLYYAYERFVQQAESRIGSMIGADGALYAVRRRLFSPPPDDTILDDMAIPLAVIRSGHRVVYEPRARAYEHGSVTALEEYHRKCRVIAGAVQFMLRSDSSVPARRPQVIISLLSHKALRWLSPAFATSALVSSLLLMRGSNRFSIAVSIQVGFVLMGLAGCLPSLRRLGPISFAHYFCLVQAAAAVGFMRGLFGWQSVRWRRFIRPAASAAL